MRAVVTRVKSASVEIEGKIHGSIGKGFLVLLGVHKDDTEAEAKKIADKICGLRIFEDADGRMNESITQHNGEILSISQFTLYGNIRKGNRPSFIAAGAPEHAKRVWLAFNEALRAQGLTVKEGRFGAHMRVSLVNDGPVTLVVDTAEVLGE